MGDAYNLYENVIIHNGEQLETLINTTKLIHSREYVHTHHPNTYEYLQMTNTSKHTSKDKPV